MSELILAFDFRGQYKELIARTVRGLSVYSEIKPGHVPSDESRPLNPIGIILTGGPDSVYLPDSPRCDDRTYDPVIAVRAMTASDFTACEYTPLPHRILNHISFRITSEIPSVSRAVYDITPKQPATVEWE